MTTATVNCNTVLELTLVYLSSFTQDSFKQNLVFGFQINFI